MPRWLPSKTQNYFGKLGTACDTASCVLLVLGSYDTAGLYVSVRFPPVIILSLGE